MSHYSTASRDHGKRKRLKPAGHSAAIEALIQPAIVVGSTLMSAIAAYVLALDEITRVLNHRGTPSDVFIIVLCAGMGFLIDMAIIVSATRYKMHAVRNDPREDRWLALAKWVLGIGLTTESMTLFYFFVHLSAAAFPGPLVTMADWIHSALAISRAFLPPVVIAYFAAGVLPVMFDRADRNREIKSRTSSNIMLLIDKLSEVFDTDDKAEMLRALGGQLMLDTYATYDETARTSEDQQLRRDAKLLEHLARIHRLDWSAIGADVAPELVTPRTASVITVTAMPEPPEPTPPDGPRGGGLTTGTQGGTNDLVYAPPVPILSGLTERNHRTSARVGLNTVAQGGTNDGTNTGTKRARVGGTSHATKRRVVRRRLSVGERNTLDHATAEEVRQKVAAGEHWTQTRIKNEYHVKNERARDIWYEVQHGQPRLRAVGMR